MMFERILILSLSYLGTELTSEGLTSVGTENEREYYALPVYPTI